MIILKYDLILKQKYDKWKENQKWRWNWLFIWQSFIECWSPFLDQKRMEA